MVTEVQKEINRTEVISRSGQRGRSVEVAGILALLRKKTEINIPENKSNSFVINVLLKTWAL